MCSTAPVIRFVLHGMPTSREPIFPRTGSSRASSRQQSTSRIYVVFFPNANFICSTSCQLYLHIAMRPNRIILAIPRAPPARYVETLHESTTSPLSISAVNGWLKNPESSSGVHWRHCLLVSEECAPHPEEIYERTVSTWTMKINDSMIPPEIFKPEIHENPDSGAGELGKGQLVFPVPLDWPDDLKQLRLYENPVISVNLFNIPDDATRDSYVQFISAIARSGEDVRIEAAGNIVESLGTAEESYNEALLLKCRSGNEFVELHRTGWLNQLAQKHALEDLLESSASLVVQEIRLPSKGEKLIHGRCWVYWDPYEGYGQDLFG